MTTPSGRNADQDKLNQLERIIEIMRQLRDPETGCPWDVEQDFSTIAPYTIEEAYEVADAVQRGNVDDIRDELGDLLLQVVFQARIAEEAGLFTLADVARGISDKMVDRHPHVFGGEDRPQIEEQSGRWEAIKAAERASKGKTGVLDDIAAGLPPMLRALKLQKRAARVGFDWANMDDIIAKLDEETAELRAEVSSDSVDQTRVMYLAELTLDFARTCLANGGSLLVKVFQGEGFDAFLKELRRSFDKVVTRKPDASRARSRELYLLARGLREPS